MQFFIRFMDVLSETTEKLNESHKAHTDKNKLLTKIFYAVIVLLALTGLILIFVGIGSKGSTSSSSSTSALQSNPFSITLNNFSDEDETQDIFSASTNPNSELEILKARTRRRRRGTGSVNPIFLVGILVFGMGWGLVACFGCCFNPCRSKTINSKSSEIVKESNEKRKFNG